MSAIETFIAIDQLINTFICDGFADETISARAFRMTDTSKVWNTAHKIIDWFALHIFNQNNHCYNSYRSEVERKQLPKEYQVSRFQSGFFTSK
jgi:hypothetical protein